VGTESSAELSVYDSRLHEFVPRLGGISAEGLSSSKDGQRATYVRLPEGSLWRIRMDGTDQVQLTFPPMKVFLPHWSPGGKQLLRRVLKSSTRAYQSFQQPNSEGMTTL
jgi:hypothetical protein